MNIFVYHILKIFILENKIQEAISARELLEKYMEKLNSELQNFQMALDEQYGSAIAEEIEKSKIFIITYLSTLYFNFFDFTVIK